MERGLDDDDDDDDSYDNDYTDDDHYYRFDCVSTGCFYNQNKLRLGFGSAHFEKEELYGDYLFDEIVVVAISIR